MVGFVGGFTQENAAFLDFLLHMIFMGGGPEVSLVPAFTSSMYNSILVSRMYNFSTSLRAFVFWMSLVRKSSRMKFHTTARTVSTKTPT